jgi:plastocyanin
MKRIRFAAAAVAAAALCAVPLAQAHSDATTLTAVVGPGFNITLTKGGKKVTALKAGRYTIKVSDKSNIHNFHLTGPGVNRSTSVSATRTETWRVKFKKGTYKYICDPHASSMKGAFKVS